MRPVSRQASLFGKSVIRAMTRVAGRYGAINLSRGFPDWDPPCAPWPSVPVDSFVALAYFKN